MATLKPELKEILEFSPKPIEGEITLLEYLEKNLPDDCIIYANPKNNYSFPDIIILRENHGAIIIEVHDWDLDKCREHHNPKIKTYWEVLENGYWRERKSPIKQIKKFKDSLLKYYDKELTFEALMEKNIYAVIRPVIFMSGATAEQIKEHFSDIPEIKNNYIWVISENDLHNGRFLDKLYNGYELLGTYSKYFNEDILNMFNRILSPSKYSMLKKDLKNVQWTKEQQRYIRSERNVQKKIKGVAGSGKTTVMAARAIDAYRKTGKPILILTFNITLKRYIRDCIDALPGGGSWNIIVDHYHHFASAYRNKAAVRELKYLPTSFKFSTIYVDEIQDYKTEWIDDIKESLTNRGELIFFGDEKQNIYARELTDEDEGLSKALRVKTGIPGRWGLLRGSKRCNGGIAYLAQLFQKEFMQQYKDASGEWSLNIYDLFTPARVGYALVEDINIGKICTLVQNVIKKYNVHFDDICILANKIEKLRELEVALNKRGYETETTFETQKQYEMILERIRNRKPTQASLDIYEADDDVEDNLSADADDEDVDGLNEAQQYLLDRQLYYLRRAAKCSFIMEAGKVKLTTIYSYKGWGIDTEILILDGINKIHENTNALIYTAITRARTNLFIINLKDNAYHEFFQKAMERIDDKY